MRRVRPEPSTLRVLKTDYPALLLLMGIVIAWVLVAAVGGSGLLPNRRRREVEPVDPKLVGLFAASAAVFTALGGRHALRRVATIKRVVSAGPHVEGTVTSIWFEKDRGRVEYDYEHEGRPYQGGNAIWKNAETTRLQRGAKVTIVVDPQDPKQAYVASLFT